MEQKKKPSAGNARSARAQKTRQRRYYKQNKKGMICITGIVIVLVLTLSTQIINLYGKIKDQEKEIGQLTDRYEEEQERQEALMAYSEYVTTPEYIEQIAKTKLGLVYSNEIIFKEQP